MCHLKWDFYHLQPRLDNLDDKGGTYGLEVGCKQEKSRKQLQDLKATHLAIKSIKLTAHPTAMANSSSSNCSSDDGDYSMSYESYSSCLAGIPVNIFSLRLMV